MFEAEYVPRARLLKQATFAVYGVPETAANVCEKLIVNPVGVPWFAASLVKPPGVGITPLTITLAWRSIIAVDAAVWVYTRFTFTKTSSS